MTILGWVARYNEIISEFGYSKKKDIESARMLDTLLTKSIHISELKKIIENKPVFIVGAGPSLPSCIPILKKYNRITKIVADGATKALIENGLKANIVVTEMVQLKLW